MESHNKNKNRDNKNKGCKIAEEMEKSDDDEGEDGEEQGCVWEGGEDDDGRVVGVAVVGGPGPHHHITLGFVGLGDVTNCWMFLTTQVLALSLLPQILLSCEVVDLRQGKVRLAQPVTGRLTCFDKITG